MVIYLKAKGRRFAWPEAIYLRNQDADGWIGVPAHPDLRWRGARFYPRSDWSQTR